MSIHILILFPPPPFPSLNSLDDLNDLRMFSLSFIKSKFLRK